MYQIKAYNEGKDLLGTLTFEDHGVTQGQDQKCQISLFKPLEVLIITSKHLNGNFTNHEVFRVVEFNANNKNFVKLTLRDRF